MAFGDYLIHYGLLLNTHTDLSKKLLYDIYCLCAPLLRLHTAVPTAPRTFLHHLTRRACAFTLRLFRYLHISRLIQKLRAVFLRASLAAGILCFLFIQPRLPRFARATRYGCRRAPPRLADARTCTTGIIRVSPYSTVATSISRTLSRLRLLSPPLLLQPPLLPLVRHCALSVSHYLWSTTCPSIPRGQARNTAWRFRAEETWATLPACAPLWTLISTAALCAGSMLRACAALNFAGHGMCHRLRVSAPFAHGFAVQRTSAYRRYKQFTCG